MKNLLLPMAVAFVMLATACSKDRDCVCTYTDSKGESVTETTSIKGSKSASKKGCEKKDEEWKDVNGSCELK